MTRPTVLVTGGAGFIGSHVATQFASVGCDVRVLDDLSTGFRENLAHGWAFHQASILDAAATRAAVEGCNAVVHLAAFTSVPESFDRPDDCFRTNVEGTRALLTACVEAGVERLVFASSSAVYAEGPDRPKREDEPPDPASPYASSKLQGEQLLEDFHERHQLSSIALRFFNVYGPRQRADSDCAAAVPIFFERSLRGDPLTIYGEGRQTRDFVFVGDVAAAIYQASQSRSRGAFNIGCGRPCEILELAERIQKLAGAQPEHCFAPLREGDLLASTAELSRTREELGWQAQVSLETGLAETLAWQRRRSPVSTP